MLPLQVGVASQSDTETKHWELSQHAGHSRYVNDVCWLHNIKGWASASVDSDVRIWSRSLDGKVVSCLYTLNVGFPVWSVLHVMPKGSVMCLAHQSCEVWEWRIEAKCFTKALDRSIVVPARNRAVRNATVWCFERLGPITVLGCSNGTILIQRSPGTVPEILVQLRSGIRRLRVSKGPTLAVCCINGSMLTFEWFGGVACLHDVGTIKK